ncbi:MAG: 23S rRNA (guanosine(2251)-2'-O)-methyltransferase RlmB, partial [Mycobacteriales bacterium]
PGARPRDRPRGRRAADNVEVVVGRNPVLEALRAQIPATALYLLTDADPDQRLTEAAKLAAGRGLPVIEVPRIELDRLTGGDRHGSVLHQGIGLQVPPFRYAHPDELLERALARSPGLIVAIDGITDPRNLGAVIRSAAGFGAQGVVVPERRAAGVTAAAWRTSAGAAARVPVARATNLVRTLTAYRKAGLIIAGLSADGGTSLDDFALASDPLCVVVGSEGRGLSRLVGETCEVQVAIPMSARLESLNASVAAAVVLAEVARRRRLPS